MKVILYMAMSVNGMIAKSDDSTDFVSPSEWKNFISVARKCGNIVIGRRTYEIMKKDELKKLGKIKVIVVSSTDQPGVTVAKTPRDAVSIAKKFGFKEVLVAGGGNLNSCFMLEKLVDEIYMDVMPAVIGSGIQLFACNDFESKLKLLGTKKLSANEIQLHYKILK
jgi:dihydrofolate reductase